MSGGLAEPVQGSDFIFLSHSGAETEAAIEVARTLKSGGLRVWLDVEQLGPGDLWMDRIEAALSRSRHMVVYIGASGVRNWVGREVRFALDRSTTNPDFRLIPSWGRARITKNSRSS